MNNEKLDTIKLHVYLLTEFGKKIESGLISRQEYDLLKYAVLTSNKVGFVKLFSYCEKSDFVFATYEKLREKILGVFPDLKLDNQIRFFHNSAYTLRTQEQIVALADEIYSKPTPKNQICTSKNLQLWWAEFVEDKQAVAIKTIPIRDSFAKQLSKAVIDKADDDSFRWCKNKDGNLDGCSIKIDSIEKLHFYLGDLLNTTNKNARPIIGKFDELLKNGGNGFTIIFHTKAPAEEKTEKKEWVKPKPTHFTLSDLKKRKWNTKMVEQYLGEPDTYFENIKNKNAPIHGYDMTRVKKFERTSTFKSLTTK